MLLFIVPYYTLETNFTLNKECQSYRRNAQVEMHIPALRWTSRISLSSKNYHSKTNRELVLPNANHHCLYKFIAYDVLWCDSILSNLLRLDQIHVRSYEVVLQYSGSTVCPICPTCPCCLVAQIFPGPSSRLLLWLVFRCLKARSAQSWPEN